MLPQSGHATGGLLAELLAPTLARLSNVHAAALERSVCVITQDLGSLVK